MKCRIPLVFFFTLLFFPSLLHAQNLKMELLRKEILALADSFGGDLGVYVEHIPSGAKVEIQSDTIFPTASIVKIPILLGIFDQVEKGNLDFYAPLVYRDSIRYGGAGIMQFFKDSTETNLNTLVALMLSYSDNTTSLWNQALAGGGTQINQLMENLGYTHTRVNSRTEGRQHIWEKYGWGQTTPAEMADIFKRIYAGGFFSAAASEHMYRMLSNTLYLDYSISAIPPGVNVASKQGMVSDSRSEVLLVNAPEGAYVLAIFTKNNEDKSWAYANEAYELQRKISALTWKTLNPSHPYTPKEGYLRYMEGVEN
ncbi:serine hydrolase [Algoriphagus namhaensis]